MNRVAHLKYFPQLLGDKMSREPRPVSYTHLDVYKRQIMSILIIMIAVLQKC